MKTILRPIAAITAMSLFFSFSAKAQTWGWTAAPNYAFRITNANGYLELGPQNTSFCHIYTDRPVFAFNKDIFSIPGNFTSWSTANLTLGTGNGGGNTFLTRLTILNSNGNVGIGTTTPLTKLQVSGSALFSTTGAPVSAAYIQGGTAYSSATNPDYTWWNNDHAGIFHPAGDVIGFAIGSLGERMRIHSNGCVGIGTTTPDAAYLLSVNGKIRAKEIKVETGWSDFVFEKNYKLLSLNEVEQFINSNGHLPEIPSAKEVETNGVDVGQMESKLLQKIEELTLYLIELKKANEIQKAKIAELEILMHK